MAESGLGEQFSEISLFYSNATTYQFSIPTHGTRNMLKQACVPIKLT